MKGKKKRIILKWWQKILLLLFSSQPPLPLKTYLVSIFSYILIIFFQRIDCNLLYHLPIYSLDVIINIKASSAPCSIRRNNYEKNHEKF